MTFGVSRSRRWNVFRTASWLSRCASGLPELATPWHVVQTGNLNCGEACLGKDCCLQRCHPSCAALSIGQQEAQIKVLQGTSVLYNAALSFFMQMSKRTWTSFSPSMVSHMATPQRPVVAVSFLVLDAPWIFRFPSSTPNIQKTPKSW